LEKMAKQAIHVLPNRHGGWATKEEGAERAKSVHATQKEALSHAREVAQRMDIEIVIHGRDGRIRDTDSSRTVHDAPARGRFSASTLKSAILKAKKSSDTFRGSDPMPPRSDRKR
jgi:hypothetical protein